MATAATQPSSEQLSGFFGDYAKTRNTPEKKPLSEWLPSFFDSFSAFRAQLEIPKTKHVTIDPGSLASFLASLEKPLIAAREAALNFDLWDIAGLETKEIRNAAVLAWLLNPRGSHGLGSTTLNSVLTFVESHYSSFFNNDFPIEPGQYCQVRKELNPNNEMGDRVDIEIDSQNFYLIVEVKIYAPEQPDQLERYCQLAAERAGKRPWAVIFITPQGKRATSAGQYANSGQIIPVSWKKLAFVLEKGLPAHKETPLGQTFPSFSRQIAIHAVRRFLKKIRSF